MIWKVPTIWEKECYIIGGGTSLLKQFNIPIELTQEVYSGVSSPSVYSPFLSKLHDKHVIATNAAYRIGNWMDFLIFGDEGFWKSNKDGILSFPGLKIYGSNKEMKNPNVLQVRRSTKGDGLSSNPNFLSWNQNTGAMAINLATLLGCKKIYLLGFDMSLDSEKNQHWHKYYHSSLKMVGHSFKRHLAGFPAIARDAEKIGVEIINLNPDSAINCFEKKNFSDIEIG